MLRSTFLQNTRIAEFYGRPDNWGSAVRTIKGTPGGFTCMTTIGYRIAAACGDGTVGIYDSVTGVLRLSLNPTHPTGTMTGSPDGSVLFCTHRDSHLATLWDIQTGGLIHTFVLRGEAKDSAISLRGRYLACGLSDGSVDFWAVANRTEGPVFGSGSPITRLCWLAPEEQLMVANEASVYIRDVVAGITLRRFETRDPVHDAVYFHKLNQLAVMTRSGAESIITIINHQTDTSSRSYGVKLRLSCFASFPTTNEVLCGMEAPGLQLFNILTRRWRHFSYPATITSVFTLSNGTVVVNATGFGIQLLDLKDGYPASQRIIAPTLTVHPFDEGRIIAIIPVTRDRVTLLESATMLRLLTIPAVNRTIPTDCSVVFCASLKGRMTVHCFEEGGKGRLQLWRFFDANPSWTVETDEPPVIGAISPAGAWIVTFHDGHSRACVCIWDVENGRLMVSLPLDYPRPTRPLDITFDSERSFYSHHDAYRIPFDIISSWKSGTPSDSIIRRLRLPPAGKSQKRQYHVDDGHEWVVSGSQRICWIPPGYIGPIQSSYCWAGTSLVMVGQDGTLRKLTFRESLS